MKKSRRVQGGGLFLPAVVHPEPLLRSKAYHAFHGSCIERCCAADAGVVVSLKGDGIQDIGLYMEQVAFALPQDAEREDEGLAADGKQGRAHVDGGFFPEEGDAQRFAASRVVVNQEYDGSLLFEDAQNGQHSVAVPNNLVAVEAPLAYHEIIEYRVSIAPHNGGSYFVHRADNAMQRGKKLPGAKVPCADDNGPAARLQCPESVFCIAGEKGRSVAAEGDE